MPKYYRVEDVNGAIRNNRSLSKEEKTIIKDILSKCEPVDANDEEIGFKISSFFYEGTVATALHRAKNAREMAYLLNDNDLVGADLLTDIPGIIQRLQQAPRK